MGRRWTMPPGLADLLRPLCRFDLDAPGLTWTLPILARHDVLLEGHGLARRQRDLGMSYAVEEGTPPSLLLVAHGHGSCIAWPETLRQHDAGITSRRAGRWFDDLVERRLGAERVIAEGGDPLTADAARTIGDPCLLRALAHRGIAADDLLARLPPLGRIVTGAGWRGGGVHDRVVDAGPVEAHFERTAGRLRTLRIRLGDQGHYDPPEPRESRRVGIVSLRGVQLPETLRAALIGQPLSKLVEHPALDPAATIRAVARSGSGVSARVETADTPVRMG